MRMLIGPFWILNQEKKSEWGYLDLQDGKFAFYFWNTTHWSMLHTEKGEAWYTYFPEDQSFVAWHIAEEGLIKAPLLINNTTGERRLNLVLQPTFLENEIRWLPVPMKRASHFAITPEGFPLEAHAPIKEDAPSLEKLSVVSKSTPVFFSQPVLFPSPIDAQLNVLKTRLTLKQQSYIVQNIAVSDHWPLTVTMSRQQKINLCLDLIAGRVTESTDLMPILNYRAPIFLARLMNGSFYPTEETAVGSQTTVGDVWFFINLLLGNAARLLGHREKIAYFAPPAGTGCTAAQFLTRRKLPVFSPDTLSWEEAHTYQIIVNHISAKEGFDIENGRLGGLTLANASSKSLILMANILPALILRQAKYIELHTKVSNAADAFLSGKEMDHDEKSEYIESELKIISQNIAQERLQRNIDACCRFSTRNKISVLAQTIRDVQTIIPVAMALESLPIYARGQLIKELNLDLGSLFILNSVAALQNMFRTTPQKYHLILIQTYAKEIIELSKVKPLGMNEYKSLLDKESFQVLKDMSHDAWKASAAALIQSSMTIAGKSYRSVVMSNKASVDATTPTNAF